MDRLPLFMAKVQLTATCWFWTAALNAKGYGKFSTGDGSWQLAHRWIFERLRRPIALGMTLDHLCRVRRCVNPDHLEEVTTAENTRRGEVGALQRAKTICKHGHALTADNIKRVGPAGRHRACRECIRLYRRGYKILAAMGRV